MDGAALVTVERGWVHRRNSLARVAAGRARPSSAPRKTHPCPLGSAKDKQISGHYALSPLSQLTRWLKPVSAEAQNSEEQ